MIQRLLRAIAPLCSSPLCSFVSFVWLKLLYFSQAFKDELNGFSTSKGTIHFPLDKPMPLELIKKMVKARVEFPAMQRVICQTDK